MAALAANAVKSQRKKAANKMVDQAMNNVNEQRVILNNVKRRHSISSLSTIDSLKIEVTAESKKPCI